MQKDEKLRNITSATTTTVKTGGGYLNRITINTTAAGAITVYDNVAASGTQLAAFPSNAVVGTYEFGGRFTTGLTIVTGAASNITVSYN